MPPNDTPPEAEATTEFERQLTDLIATAFAHGTPIERTWEVTVPATGAPNWTVHVSRMEPDETAYQPTLLEE
ncbi:hypothetical protein RBH26_12500 [Natronolimnohabitans sp. A-GB9]|uniref:hypothetical protein n=1 Tax=Natronolimnohabitans sp. A-GB9 TaxID=3069757 RepID=UPI0027B0B07A|nr:hypothetical protein [Natronolimnohabitans sp. A-GB9]MDQ2051300.1 hypothetical protein [Natronolimnohabitans sp. A-GB9]